MTRLSYWLTVLLVAATMAACGGGDDSNPIIPIVQPPAPTVNVTGTWSGPYSFKSATFGQGSATMTLQLVQNGAGVTGSFSTTTGAQGSISGTVSSNVASIIIAVTTPGCSGTFNGTATVTGDTMSFNYAGASSTACGGSENGSGTLSRVSAASVPSAPSGLNVSPGVTQNVISWGPVAGASSYNLYWSNSAGVTTTSGTKITGVTSPYTHSGLVNGTPYYYIVTALNNNGESAVSSEVSATPQAVAPATYAISGTITTGTGAALPGATVALSGGPGATTTTDSGGVYTFMGLVNGSYTVTPTMSGYLFTPPNRPVTVNGATVNGQNFTATQNTWSPGNTGLTSTNISSIAIDPVTTQTVYAGTAGGIFKSVNGGSSWSASSTGLSNTTVKALAVSRSDAATLYAGTSGGVFKSVDGGTTWTAANSGLARTDILSLAVDPTNSQVVYAGTGDGLFKSGNGGTSWSDTGLASQTDTVKVTAIAIDPTNPQIVYVGTNGFAFKSSNGGSTWNYISTGITMRTIYSLAVDPTSPQTLYAATGYDSGTFGGVFKSTNGGASWTNTGPTNYGIYAVAIDPIHPQTVYAASNGSVLKSTNGGGSWSAVSSGLPSSVTTVNAVTIDPVNPQHVYLGTNGGIFATQ